ncbi:hypothetical protein [Bradyrhizobium elkanii]
MSDNKSARDNERYPLDVLKRHLDTPQLLPHENAKDFNQLLGAGATLVFGSPNCTWINLSGQHQRQQ